LKTCTGSKSATCRRVQRKESLPACLASH